MNREDAKKCIFATDGAPMNTDELKSNSYLSVFIGAPSVANFLRVFLRALRVFAVEFVF